MIKTVWMEGVIWESSNLNLVFTIISFVCVTWMSRVQGFGKTFDEEKECVIISVPTFTVYKNKWAL